MGLNLGTDFCKVLDLTEFVDSFKILRCQDYYTDREFGKKFENVVNGEERHKYRFDPYENRQGKISYKFEVDTKAGVITGWKEL